MQRKIRPRPRFWRFVILMTLIVFGVSCGVAQLRYAQIASRVRALQAERDGLTEQVASLTERLDYVRTDEYVERVARDELNMLRPGEIRYVSN